MKKQANQIYHIINLASLNTWFAIVRQQS